MDGFFNLSTNSVLTNQSMSMGCVGKLGHLFGFLRHNLLILLMDGGQILSHIETSQSELHISFQHKYSSLNWNVIVTYGYDCENGVDECVKQCWNISILPRHRKK